MLDEVWLRGLLDDAIARSGVVGAQLAVSTGNETVALASGLADARHDVAMTPETLMQIGSVTKVVNAALVASFAHDGLVDLDVPVVEYLPRLRDRRVPGNEALTLRHALTMSSGLDNGPYHYLSDDDTALERYVDRLVDLPSHFLPGTHFGYANAGACIAGRIASIIGGAPWEDVVADRILRPAGLTRWALLDEHLVGTAPSVGHNPREDWGLPAIVEPRFSAVRGRAPSGSCFALTMADLARFGRLFLTAGRSDDGAAVLDPAVVAEMTTEHVPIPTRRFGEAWGLGPYAGRWSGVTVWGHSGGTVTSGAHLLWIPAKDAVVAFAVNSPAAFDLFAEIVFTEIVPALFGVAKPRHDLPEGGSSADLERVVGTYDDLATSLTVAVEAGDILTADFRRREHADWWGAAKSSTRSILLPLGGDRFLVVPRDGRATTYDLTFFGDAGDGRARNTLNSGVFPMTRTA
jgi:CubicO group peptidase (beta-lactamase class C family)